MRVTPPRVLLVAAAVCGLASCVVTIAPGAACNSTADCPPPQVCVANICVIDEGHQAGGRAGGSAAGGASGGGVAGGSSAAGGSAGGDSTAGGAAAGGAAAGGAAAGGAAAGGSAAGGSAGGSTLPDGGQAESCTDGVDNDGDTMADCADSDCVAQVCRVAAGACDAPEVCTAGQCPLDEKRAPATVCRPAVAGGCDVAESCDGMSNDCPVDGFVSQGTTCRPAAAGGCDVAETCTGTSAMCPADQLAPASTVCRPAAGLCDVAETCTGTSAMCPANGFRPTTDVCRAAVSLCDAAETCTGGPDCPVDAVARVGTTCRPAAGACDVAETCDGATTVCPADRFAGSGSVCRPAAPGGCDVEEVCSGMSASCPTDAFLPPSTTCRPAASVCDRAEFCTGSSATCPGDVFVPASPPTTCRGSTGSCDPAEVCTGTSGTCPADVMMCPSSQYCAGGAGCQPKKGLGQTCMGAGECTSGFCANGVCCNSACNGACEVCSGTGSCGFQPSSFVCRPSGGACDPAERCSGSSATCPADALEPNTTVCRASAGPCDPAETCTGTSPVCPIDARAGGSTVCRSSQGVCDPQEVCSGTSVDCPADVLASPMTICRPSAGACDVVETCTGTSAQCPADTFQPANTPCGLAFCMNGQLTPAPRCTGGGATACMSFAPVSCGGFQCNASSSGCLTACAPGDGGVDPDCMPTHYCNGTSCTMKLGDGASCTASVQCQNVNGCLTGYVDNDNDGYGTTPSARFCGVLPTSPTRYVALPGDCCDFSNLVRPNQTAYFSTAATGSCSSVGFNYNCSFNILTGSPTLQHEYPSNGCIGQCSPTIISCTGTGWGGTFPGCGVTGGLRTCGTGNLICGGGELIMGCTNIMTNNGQVDRCH